MSRNFDSTHGFLGFYLTSLTLFANVRATPVVLEEAPHPTFQPQRVSIGMRPGVTLAVGAVVIVFVFVAVVVCLSVIFRSGRDRHAQLRPRRPHQTAGHVINSDITLTNISPPGQSRTNNNISPELLGTTSNQTDSAETLPAYPPDRIPDYTPKAGQSIENEADAQVTTHELHSSNGESSQSVPAAIPRTEVLNRTPQQPALAHTSSRAVRHERH